ncbi:MAG: POTRA domain-containing protein, partial [Pseudomonadota bacterium]
AGDESASKLKFKVKRIAITKSAVLPADRLRPLIARVEGQEVVLEDLNRLVRDITQLYQDVRFPVGFAILPPQEVKNGVVQIVLIEPRVDDVGVQSSYTDPDFIRDRIPLKAGALVDVHALEEALFILSRTTVSGIQVAARLVPGKDFATTKIVLDVIEPPRHSVFNITDNHGTEENGEIRNQTIYRNTSLLGRDDPLSLGVSFSKGSKSTFGFYDAPIGIAGTRMELQYSLSESRIVAGSFEDLDLESDGQFAAAEIRHPFHISRDWMHFGLIETAFSHGRTVTGPLEVGTAVGRLALGSRLFKFDDDGSIELTNKLAFIRSRAYDNIGVEWDSFIKYTGDLRAVRRIGPVTLIGDAAWQLSPNELLPSAEQFAFGGVSTARAYEINQFNGDEGYWARLEAHGPGLSFSDVFEQNPLGGHINVFAFAETGGAFPFRSVGPSIRREDFASDIGLGIDLSLLNGKLNSRAMVAKALDEIHDPLITNDPKFLFDTTLNINF